MNQAAIAIPEKLFFKIGEVCELAGVQAHVLRYWETEFPMLAPQKNRAGQRTYRRRDVEMALRIKQLLYDEQYTIAGNDNNALVIPAGLAFARAIAKRPDLEFYQPDKRHPSLIGTYLAACTVYAAVYKKSPVGNTYNAGIDSAIATFLQNTAQETVQEYFAN